MVEGFLPLPNTHKWNVMATFSGASHRHSDIFSGALVFVGTRVPVRSLFDYLEVGDTLEEFLRQFPSEKREAAVGVLDVAHESMAFDANSH